MAAVAASAGTMYTSLPHNLPGKNLEKLVDVRPKAVQKSISSVENLPDLLKKAVRPCLGLQTLAPRPTFVQELPEKLQCAYCNLVLQVRRDYYTV